MIGRLRRWWLRRQTVRRIRRMIASGEAVGFHEQPACPTCGKVVTVSGLWPTDRGIFPGVTVRHLADGGHAPDMTIRNRRDRRAWERHETD